MIDMENTKVNLKKEKKLNRKELAQFNNLIKNAEGIVSVAEQDYKQALERYTITEKLYSIQIKQDQMLPNQVTFKYQQNPDWIRTKHQLNELDVKESLLNLSLTVEQKKQDFKDVQTNLELMKQDAKEQKSKAKLEVKNGN